MKAQASPLTLMLKLKRPREAKKRRKKVKKVKRRRTRVKLLTQETAVSAISTLGSRH